MKKFYRQDLTNLANLIYESPMDISMDLDTGFNDDLGGGDEFGLDQEVDVMGVGVAPPTGMAPVPSGYADEDTKVLKANLKKLADYSARLVTMDLSGFEPWMQAKIALAADYADDVWHMLDAGADFANTGFEQAGPEQDISF